MIDLFRSSTPLLSSKYRNLRNSHDFRLRVLLRILTFFLLFQIQNQISGIPPVLSSNAVNPDLPLNLRQGEILHLLEIHVQFNDDFLLELTFKEMQ